VAALFKDVALRNVIGSHFHLWLDKIAKELRRTNRHDRHGNLVWDELAVDLTCSMSVFNELSDWHELKRTVYQARSVCLQDTSQSTRTFRRTSPFSNRLPAKSDWVIALSFHEERPELFFSASDKHNRDVNLVEERNVPCPDATLLILTHDV
jgi:hypothetical protein